MKYIIAFLFAVLANISFAQVETCDAYYVHPNHRIHLDPVSKGFFWGLTNEKTASVYVNFDFRYFSTPETIFALGLYIEDFASPVVIEVPQENGAPMNRRCGARIYPVTPTHFMGTPGVDNNTGWRSEKIEGCPDVNVPVLTGARWNRYPYGTQLQAGSVLQTFNHLDQYTRTGVSSPYMGILGYVKIPKGPTNDVFSLGWFQFQGDQVADESVSTYWKNQAGQSPAYAMYLRETSGQEFCYSGANFKIFEGTYLSWDENSTIINGKKWREYYAEFNMEQMSCFDCLVKYAPNLYNMPSPAGTTNDAGAPGTGGSTGGESGTTGACAEGDTRAACSTLSDPSTEPGTIPALTPSLDNGPIASPWSLSGSASCPADITLPHGGVWSFSGACDLISGPMRALVIFLASMSALAIVLPRS